LPFDIFSSNQKKKIIDDTDDNEKLKKILLKVIFMSFLVNDLKNNYFQH
jgi:hypothetical protein